MLAVRNFLHAKLPITFGAHARAIFCTTTTTTTTSETASQQAPPSPPAPADSAQIASTSLPSSPNDGEAKKRSRDALKKVTARSPVKYGLKHYLDLEVREFEMKTGLAFTDLRSEAVDEIIGQRRKVLQRKQAREGGQEHREAKMDTTMKFLEPFSEAMTFFYKYERVDPLVYAILFHNLHDEPNVKIEKDYHNLRDKRVPNSIKNNMDTAVFHKNSLVLINSCWTTHLIDVAVIRNCFRAIEYTQMWNKESIQFGIASDLFSAVITCYDPKTGQYKISSPYKLYAYTERNFQRDEITRLVQDTRALLIPRRSPY